MERLSPRTGYIRTTPHPESEYKYECIGIFALVVKCMRQTSSLDLAAGKPRHRFLFGAVNAADAVLLDVFISHLQPRTSTPSDPIIRWPFQNAIRSDVRMHISQANAATCIGEKLLKRCADEGITFSISGATDEECDEAMLEESDYLIDEHTYNLCWNGDWWYWNHARPGVPQDNMLMNPKYDVRKHDVSESRLRYRYSQYGWKASSGGYHGNGPWRCRMCNGKCKRGKCKNGPPKEKEEEFRRYEEERDKWKNECLLLPKSGDEKLKTLTAEEVCRRFSLQQLAKYKRYSEKWESIDSFSAK